MARSYQLESFHSKGFVEEGTRICKPKPYKIGLTIATMIGLFVFLAVVLSEEK